MILNDVLFCCVVEEAVHTPSPLPPATRVLVLIPRDRPHPGVLSSSVSSSLSSSSEGYIIVVGLLMVGILVRGYTHNGTLIQHALQAVRDYSTGNRGL